MMFKKKLLASAMATALVSGAMMVGGAQAVTMSNTSVGQMLLGDMYVARTTDYSTTAVKVINTSTTDAVKAKLVFRSKKHSDECRDLILYLTPGDVAYVDVRLNATTGQPEVWSDDDSILAKKMSDGTAIFASQVFNGAAMVGSVSTPVAVGTGLPTGVAFPMVAPRTEPTQDTCAQGHIEVVAAYAVGGTVTNLVSGLPNVTIVQGMSKHNLIRVFDTPKEAPSGAELNVPANNITNNAVANGAGFTARTRLKGNVEIKSGNDRLMAPMLAVREGINARSGGVSTDVVNNPAFDVSLGAETFIGSAFGDGVTQPTEMLGDIEGALTTNRLFNVYEQKATNFEVTFPTKYRHIVTGRYSGAGATYEPPFESRGEVAYGVSLFDNQERSAPGTIAELCVVSPCSVPVVSGNYLIHEVNFEAILGNAGWDPLSGWYNMTLVNRAGLDQYGYTWVSGIGAPASGYTHFYKSPLAQSVISPMGR